MFAHPKMVEKKFEKLSNGPLARPDFHYTKILISAAVSDLVLVYSCKQHRWVYLCMNICYSAPSRFLLGGAPDYSADTESEFHAEAHEQLRVKDLPRVPPRRLEVDSNPQPSGCKAPTYPYTTAPHK